MPFQPNFLIVEPGSLPPEAVFLVHLVLGYTAWTLCFRAYLWPRLAALEPTGAQRAIASLHSFRFFGLAFLLPGFVGPNLPAGFGQVAAYGVLAILALLTFRMRPLFWLFVVAFNLVGVSDLVLDYAHAIQFHVPEAAGELGAAYAIPVLYVPLLMITHVAALSLLVRQVSIARRGPRAGMEVV